MIEAFKAAGVTELQYFYNGQAEYDSDKTDQQKQNANVAVFAACVNFMFNIYRHLPAPKPVVTQSRFQQERAEMCEKVVKGHFENRDFDFVLISLACGIIAAPNIIGTF